MEVFSDVRVLVSVCSSVRQSVRQFVRPSRRRARCLLFAHLLSSAACLCTTGTLAPEPVPPLSLHPATLPALQRNAELQEKYRIRV